MNRKRSKLKKRIDPSKKKATNPSFDSAQLLTGNHQGPTYLATRPRKIRSDRFELIGLALASLVAGFLIIVNCDRLTHQSSQLADGESRHGWPLVYLTRNFVKIPEIYYPHEIYAWPYPPVYNETREFVWQNLVINLLVGGGIVVASYFAISRLVLRYDRWQFGEKT